MSALARCLPVFGLGPQEPERTPPPLAFAPLLPLVPTRAPSPEPTPDPFENPWIRAKRPEPPAPPPEDREALLREAEARGRSEGLAQGRAEAEAALAAERATFEDRLLMARRHWAESEAETLASGFAAALRSLDAELTGRIARLLVPVLTDALRREAIAELGSALGRLLADPQHAAIRVSGPQDLLDALSRRLGPMAEGVTFVPGEAAEVSVVADQTVMETRINAWTRLLSAAVES